MADIIKQRMAADIEGDFVVFMIGMRINRWWKPWSWLPIFFAMPKMLKELAQHPELGCLGSELSLGLVIQYWRSFDDLAAYARSQDSTHYPAWVAFNRRTAVNGDVGIWHETYLVPAGHFEAVYNHVPQRGLGKAGRLVPAAGRHATAALRARVRADDVYPAGALGGIDDPSAPES